MQLSIHPSIYNWCIILPSWASEIDCAVLYRPFAAFIIIYNLCWVWGSVEPSRPSVKMLNCDFLIYIYSEGYFSNHYLTFTSLAVFGQYQSCKYELGATTTMQSFVINFSYYLNDQAFYKWNELEKPSKWYIIKYEIRALMFNLI